MFSLDGAEAEEVGRAGRAARAGGPADQRRRAGGAALRPPLAARRGPADGRGGFRAAQRARGPFFLNLTVVGTYYLYLSPR